MASVRSRTRASGCAADLGQRRGGPLRSGRAVERRPRRRQQVAARTVVGVDQDRAGAGAGGGQRGHQPGRARRRPPARRSARSASRSGRAADPRTAGRARPCCARPARRPPSPAWPRPAASCRGPSTPTHAFGSSPPGREDAARPPQDRAPGDGAVRRRPAAPRPACRRAAPQRRARPTSAQRLLAIDQPAGRRRLTGRAPVARPAGRSPPSRACVVSRTTLNQRRQPAVCTQRSGNGPCGLGR